MLDETEDRWKYPPSLAEQEHQAYIIIHGPGHDGTKLALREGITSFGRLPSNDVILLGDLVSRHHSRITYFEGRATLQDLGSHNGSWVNGERVATRVLKEGDVARVGNFRMAFHTGPMTDAPAPPMAPFESHEGAYKQTAAPNAQHYASVSPPQPPQPVSLSKEIEQAMSPSSSRGIQVLIKASEAVARALDVSGYMQDMLTLAMELVPSEIAAYLQTSNGQLRVVTGRGPAGTLAAPPVSMRVAHWATSKNFAVKTDEVTQDVRFSDVTGPNPGSVVCAPINATVGGQGTVIGAVYLSRLSGPYTDEDLDALTAIAHLSGTGLTQTQDKNDALSHNAAKDALLRFHPSDVVDTMFQSGPGLGPKSGTIAICSLPGFEALVPRTSPDQLSDFINDYMGQLSETAQKHKGALIGAQGTKLTILFGVPYAYGNDPARAVTAALEMRNVVNQLGQHHPALKPKQLRVGLNTGPLLAGLIGTPNRMSYTVLGETAIIAQRLEAAAAPGAILAGEATYKSVQSFFEARRLGLQQGRGQAEPLPVYEILSRKNANH